MNIGKNLGRKSVTRSRNIFAAALSAVAGVLFLVSSSHSPIRSYEFILQNLPVLINDELILSIARR
jgi:hypothetical protein